MACPFAQFSPLVLLSLLALFFQFGASFFSPKPFMASLQRGRSLAGEEKELAGGVLGLRHDDCFGLWELRSLFFVRYCGRWVDVFVAVVSRGPHPQGVSTCASICCCGCDIRSVLVRQVEEDVLRPCVHRSCSVVLGSASKLWQSLLAPRFCRRTLMFAVPIRSSSGSQFHYCCVGDSCNIRCCTYELSIRALRRRLASLAMPCPPLGTLLTAVVLLICCAFGPTITCSPLASDAAFVATARCTRSAMLLSIDLYSYIYQVRVFFAF